MEGLDLGPLLRGVPPHGLDERPLFGEAAGGLQYNATLPGPYYPVYYSVRRGRYKAVYEAVSGSFRLFDLEQDPGEQTDVAARHPVLAGELEAMLLHRIETSRQRAGGGAMPALDEAEREELRALGYIAE